MTLATLDWSQLWGSHLEMFAVITGVICVGLITFENFSSKLAWWNWPVGILTSAAYVYIFWNYGLYFNSLLQVFYVIIGFWGAWVWKKGGHNRTELPIRKYKPMYMAATLACIGLATTGLYVFADKLIPSSTSPLLDALVVTLSLAAQFVLTYKYRGHWWLWISVDIVGVYLFASQGLLLTAVLYFIYGSLCVRGIFTWASAYRRDVAVVDTSDLSRLSPSEIYNAEKIIHEGVEYSRVPLDQVAHDGLPIPPA
jgi:nicotinamide mononucleotide transporter